MILTISAICADVTYGVAVRQLREELQLLQEPGSYVGEVIKVMGKKKVLCKVFLSDGLYFSMMVPSLRSSWQAPVAVRHARCCASHLRVQHVC